MSVNHQVIFHGCFLILFNSVYLFAQSDSLSQQWLEFAEDRTDLIDLIQELQEQPVNINEADVDELIGIPLISQSIADSIIKRREISGSYKNKRQIRSIVGKNTYDLIKGFVTVSSRKTYRGLFVHKSYKAIEEIQEIETGKYLGNAYYNYNKALVKFSNNFQAGFVTQKDIGETDLLDHYGGYLQYRSIDFTVILGSYYLNFGQGLVFSNPFGQQKSSLATTPFRINTRTGIATLSSAENKNQFGLYASSGKYLPFQLHVFYALNQRDAQLNREGEEIIGIDFDGYHRTQPEIDKKQLLEETVAGLSIEKQVMSFLKLGGLYSAIQYNPEINYSQKSVGPSQFRRQYFKFSGNQLNQYSAFYELNFNEVSLSGEASGSEQGGLGIAQNLFFRSTVLDFGIKYWRLANNFYSPYGRVFDDSNPFPQATEGIYLGARIQPMDKLQINAYKILKKELWRGYFDQLPRQSDEVLVQAEYDLQHGNTIARFRHKAFEQFEEFEDGPQLRLKLEQYYYRLQFALRLSRSIRISVRWDNTEVSPIEEKGTSIFQDINWIIIPGLELRGRLTFFETDSYVSRLYEYESDLPGSFANYALYGQGWKWYVLIKGGFGNWLSLILKFRYIDIENKQPNIFDYDPPGSLDRMVRFQIQLKI